MDNALYRRPREKIRLDGVESLSTVELLQAILGSGSQQMPAARIARSVSIAVNDGHTAYNDLIQLPGVGDARACQIVAVLELARRLGVHE